ncbi:YncE family protein [Amycolatopsis sp., V23-08]|uniref:YncE family protein n=1 Tax=Amycolatopsis heterodermiae TaxID=3110235 RepID=A0ABU5RBF7_9PSEU|nr:YncE family protein [Amycolatopsis sp., V23-08]MEA5363104.1 YncE family protein [Amycolatopsis sp., V23-08]
MTDREAELRVLLDRVEDERSGARVNRFRRAARLAGWSLAALVPLGVLAGLAEPAALAAHPFGSGAGLAVLLLVGHGLSAEVHGWLRTHEEDVLRLRTSLRLHRGHRLAGWPEPGDGDAGERQRLLDDLDDARADRRRTRWQLIGALTAAAGVTGAFAAALTLLGTPWPAAWGSRLLLLGTVCCAVVAFEVVATLATGGRPAVTKANLVAARRRHREAALYDAQPPAARPGPAHLPPIKQGKGTFAAVPVVGLASLAALVLAGGFTVESAPAPPAGPAPDFSAVPTQPAGRKVAVPVDWPSGVAVAPDGRHAYVGNAGPPDRPDDTVAVVDLGTQSVTAALPVAPHPMALALTPDGHRLVVASTGPAKTPAGAFTVLDPDARRVVATIPLPGPPLDVAVSPDGQTAWCVVSGASAYDAGTAVAIDIARGAVTASIPVGVNPDAIAVDAGRAYVANFGENTVSVLDTGRNALVSTVDTTAGPGGLVLDSRRHTLWVAGQTESDPRAALTAIDTTTLAPAPVDLGAPPPGAGGPGALALTPDGRRLLVGRSSPGTAPLPLLTVVDPATRRTTGVITLPAVYRIAPGPDGHHAIAAAGDLWLLDIP